MINLAKRQLCGFWILDCLEFGKFQIYQKFINEREKIRTKKTNAALVFRRYCFNFADLARAFAVFESLEKPGGRICQRYASALRAFFAQFFCLCHFRVYFYPQYLKTRP